MSRTVPPILPLPADLAAQIKSSVTVPSLAHVIIELFKNALDAGARNVDITVDSLYGACSVEDDGCGISPKEFLEEGGLGKPYHTSKNDNMMKFHGRNGTFLSSLSALAILIITSRHQAYCSVSTLILHHSRPAARLVPAPAHHQLVGCEHGARVTVRDLFGNLPVRVKQRSLDSSKRKIAEKQWEFVRKHVVGLLLAWNDHVSVTVRDTRNSTKLIIRRQGTLSCDKHMPLAPAKPLSIAFALSVLSQSGYVEPCQSKRWVKTTARTQSISIQGIISLDPAPSKQIQFLSLGMKHLDQGSEGTILYDEINHLFSSSSFGDLQEIRAYDAVERRTARDRPYTQDDITNKQVKASGKGVDRWPIFVIRIDYRGDTQSIHGVDRNALERENAISRIIKVLRAMISSFLIENHFRPHSKHSQRAQSAIADTSQAFDAKNSNQSSSTSLHLLPISASTVQIREPTRKTSSQLFGDLGNAIKIPKLGLDRSKVAIEESPSSWSRIKSRRSKAMGNGSICESSFKPAEHTLPSPEKLNVATSAVTKERFAREATHKISSPEQGEDPVIQWTDPVLRDVLSINARTGGTVINRALTKPAASLGFEPHSCGNERRIPQGRLPHCQSSRIAMQNPDSWVGKFLKNWENPVFQPSEQSIPQVSFNGPLLEIPHTLNGKGYGFVDTDIENVFTQSSSSFSAKLSKHSLESARILAQIDRKFILALVRKLPNDSESDTSTSDHQILVLIDQHAADERIRVEFLLAGLCNVPGPSTNARPSLDQVSGIETIVLPEPINFHIQSREIELFKSHASHFERWGILFDLSSAPSEEHTARESAIVTVRALPPTVAERCRSEPKILIDMLRTEIWKRDDDGLSFRTNEIYSPTLEQSQPVISSSAPTQHPTDGDWVTKISTCPQGIIDMLNSRACRSAIMFNDELRPEECKGLVSRLAKCRFPFQCAHGRPTMVPLVAMGVVGQRNRLPSMEGTTTNEEEALGGIETTAYGDRPDHRLDFIDAYKTWRANKTEL
ncbi:MAG: hypothetical protein LQ351_006484 [Letrouitia transgressa]|nr:MAG: hypothetical protein LQ351_006484 [Letrouitia transgressa]